MPHIFPAKAPGRASPSPARVSTHLPPPPAPQARARARLAASALLLAVALAAATPAPVSAAASLTNTPEKAEEFKRAQAAALLRLKDSLGGGGPALADWGGKERE